MSATHEDAIKQAEQTHERIRRETREEFALELIAAVEGLRQNAQALEKYDDTGMKQEARARVLTASMIEEAIASLALKDALAREKPPEPEPEPVFAPPASLLNWAQEEVRRIPMGRDAYVVVGQVTLGELRAWVHSVNEGPFHERTVEDVVRLPTTQEVDAGIAANALSARLEVANRAAAQTIRAVKPKLDELERGAK